MLGSCPCIVTMSSTKGSPERRGLTHYGHNIPSSRSICLSSFLSWTVLLGSTSVIWRMRGNAANTSQWSFLDCQGTAEVYDISFKLAPGHMGIRGNEVADKLANRGALLTPRHSGPESVPTICGLRSIARDPYGMVGESAYRTLGKFATLGPCILTEVPTGAGAP